MKFSERKGIIKRGIQIESIDTGTKNRIWNSICDHYLTLNASESHIYVRLVRDFFRKREEDFFPKDSDDKIPKIGFWANFVQALKSKGGGIEYVHDYIKRFFSTTHWYRVYDFIEFLIKDSLISDERKNKFIKEINIILEEEKSAYRILENFIIDITDKEEIKEIETALKTSINTVKEHLKQSISHLSNKTNPDYRNSIKESISAVESLCRKISNNPNATLGEALKLIEKSDVIELHPALKEAFSKLYGWTSDKKSGIRHGMLEVSQIEREDARFMLIACSAFVNYLTEKSINAGFYKE